MKALLSVATFIATGLILAGVAVVYTPSDLSLRLKGTAVQGETYSPNCKPYQCSHGGTAARCSPEGKQLQYFEGPCDDGNPSTPGPYVVNECYASGLRQVACTDPTCATGPCTKPPSLPAPAPAPPPLPGPNVVPVPPALPVAPSTPTVLCPIPGCLAPPAGCYNVPNATLNADGCPAYPCGQTVCNAPAPLVQQGLEGAPVPDTTVSNIMPGQQAVGDDMPSLPSALSPAAESQVTWYNPLTWFADPVPASVPRAATNGLGGQASSPTVALSPEAPSSPRPTTASQAVSSPLVSEKVVNPVSTATTLTSADVTGPSAVDRVRHLLASGIEAVRDFVAELRRE